MSRLSDSNRRPAVYKTAALPAELRRQKTLHYLKLLRNICPEVIYQLKKATF